MPETRGRHRISRRRKIAAAVIGLLIAASSLAVATIVSAFADANAASVVSRVGPGGPDFVR